LDGPRRDDRRFVPLARSQVHQRARRLLTETKKQSLNTGAHANNEHGNDSLFHPAVEKIP